MIYRPPRRQRWCIWHGCGARLQRGDCLFHVSGVPARAQPPEDGQRRRQSLPGRIRLALLDVQQPIDVQ
jgi:hypothetical protein